MNLSSLGRRLAELVEASPTQKVDLGVLYDAAVAFDRSLATAPDARSEIRTALDELVVAGVVILPASSRGYDQREQPPLPLWVRRPPRSRSGPRPKPVRVWPAVLEAAGRIASREDELAVLEVVAAFLRGGGGARPSVPVRERSLELFGDEKRLDSLVTTRLFTAGALTFELLRCHQVPIPFASQWVPGAVDPRGTALLIAENHHTYASLLEVTRSHADRGGPGRHVGYGTGNQFPSAVLSMPLLVPQPERILYFGDIDLKGMQIPTVATLNALQAGLPAVVPAIPLYELLFAAPYRLPAKPVPADEATAVCAWLGELADAACAALVNGQRLPQEAVGYDVLSRHPEALHHI
ncbi:Wadjet anti-phage system protein JetD domain-containing protein [Kribbella shirazensis]|uniref:Wadjet protein JetD C-terminal domain-containing protein n=1 Tax=Kribbella shirazensis TaxID=1105143 RepID=A0A7X5VJW9_9ACTN|nr:DUF2220 family protein [Kribbella shirazensis]NIK61463.1 hypothetical protein [Kribbella shirazensis]